ncbi:MHO_1590 family protein [Mycoplasma sp. 005V]|uniref:MHO_1590 family protein n=1 Tax=unclassified Mycoplasma TaxID=2683645 RepID=UPI003A854B09
MLIGIGSAFGAGSFFVYNSVHNKVLSSENNNNPFSHNNKDKNTYTGLKRENFIPSLEPRYFEKFLKHDQQNKKYIDQTIINEISKDIIRRLRKNDGILYIDYNYLSPQHIVLSVLYVSKGGNAMDEKSFDIFID